MIITDINPEQHKQINLIVGDYFKAETSFTMYSKVAGELISWLRSKTYILALLREAQLEFNLPILTIIRAVLTRWTAHYLAFKRLLEVHRALRHLVSKDELRLPADSQLITGDA